MRNFYQLLIFLLVPGFCLGQEQIPVGAWRTHFNYTSAERLEFVGEKVYCTTRNGIFYYDTEGNTVSKLSKLDGLSDAGVGAMEYSESQKVLIFGYKNGNVDFISEKGVQNLDAIKRSSFDREKKYIFDIVEKDGSAYLSTGLGVVVVALQNRQIRETYRQIGPNAQEIEAFQTTFFRDSIFVASNIGILAAPFNDSINLLDFNSWTLNEDLPPGEIRGLVPFGGILIAHDGDSIFQYDGSWKAFDFQSPQNIRSITVSEEHLLVSMENSVVAIDKDGHVETFSSGLESPMHALLKDNALWVADNSRGMIHNSSGAFVTIVPNGPLSFQLSNFIGRGKSLLAVHGDFEDNPEPTAFREGFSLFENGQWIHFSADKQGAQQTPDISNFVNGDFSEDTGNTFLSSFEDGLLVWKKDGTFEIVDENSPGSTLSRNSDDELLIADSRWDGNHVWTLEYGKSQALHRWNGVDQWEAINIGNSYPRTLLNSVFGEKWIVIDPSRGGGIVVYSPEIDIYRRLSSSSGSGNLPSNHVTALAEDQDGEIWVGTVAGVVYLPQPYLALENEDGVFYSYNAIFPIVENDIFLRGQFVNDILVDPGNRKWVATREGVWVVEGNGGDVFFHFNEDNSPLPSNVVLKIEIVAETGEIFFATERGTVSFRADVSVARPNYNSVKIFPNPVYPRDNGLVTISGLVGNSVVKITDVAGREVWETRSFGGTATWDIHRSAVDTGVYLVFMSDGEADEKFVGKVAVVK